MNKKLEDKEKKWEEERKKNDDSIEKNRILYMQQRNELLKKYKGKFIAFKDGKVLKYSDDYDEIKEILDEDNTVILKHVGHEDEPKYEVLLLANLK